MMKGKAIRFFATRCDLEPVLGSIEKTERIKYGKLGMFDDETYPTYGTFTDIPDLGVSVKGDQILNPRYLVLKTETQIVTECIPQKAGGVKYANYQLLNQESIVVGFGGIFECSGILISGEVSTISSDPNSISLFKLFSRSIRKQFAARIDGYYIGTEAWTMLENGARLTDSVKSPPEYDIKIATSSGGSFAPRLPVQNDRFTNRLSYEDSVRRLQNDFLDDGDIPPIPERMPAFDDEELGVSFFKEEVGDPEGDPADLSNLTLPRTFIGRCLVINASFTNNDFTESNFCWNDFEDVDFSGAILAKSDLRASNYLRVNFTSADLRQADLRYASYTGCDFKNADVTGATIAKEQLTEMNLTSEQIATANIVAGHGPEPAGG